MSHLRKWLRLEVETITAEHRTQTVPMMTKVTVKRPGISYYALHVFHRRDVDVAWHDHKQGFWTFPLRSYVEEVYDPATITWSFNVVKAWRRHYRPMGYAHRYMGAYAGMSPDGLAPISNRRLVVTLVKWVGPRRDSWGFWVPQGTGNPKWIEWRDFVFKGVR